MKTISYNGGIGDSLMLSCLARELKRRGEECILATRHPEVFINNTDVHTAVVLDSREHHFALKMGETVNPTYLVDYNHETDTRTPLKESVYVYMAKRLGLEGEIDARPYFYNIDRNIAKNFRTVIFQSSGIGSRCFAANKEWFPERMAEVVSWAKGKGFTTVQIGLYADYNLNCDFDLCGKTSIAETAELLYSARLFVGLEGFPMHLARAVDCPSVIVYGGRLKPWQIGYSCNINLVRGCPDEKHMINGCWRSRLCDHDMQCMRDITTIDVINGIIRMLDRDRNSLRIDRYVI